MSGSSPPVRPRVQIAADAPYLCYTVININGGVSRSKQVSVPFQHVQMNTSHMSVKIL
jgi:hypothetical protein